MGLKRFRAQLSIRKKYYNTSDMGTYRAISHSNSIQPTEKRESNNSNQPIKKNEPNKIDPNTSSNKS